MQDSVTPLTNETEPEPNLPVYYTLAVAAKRLNISYMRIKYAISNDWVRPFQKEPVELIEEGELFRYANEQKIEIPNK